MTKNKIFSYIFVASTIPGLAICQEDANNRRAINVGDQATAEFKAGPETETSVIIYASGKEDGVYFAVPSVNIDFRPIDELFLSGKCAGKEGSPDLAQANVRILPAPSGFDISYISNQIETKTGQSVTALSLIPHTIVRATFTPDEPNAKQIRYSRDVNFEGKTVSEALSKLQPRPFKSDEVISFKFQASCVYWNKFRNPNTGASGDLGLEFSVPVNQYLSSTVAYSVDSFMNSTEAQEIFSDQSTTGKLRFEQTASSKSGGILKGIFGNNSANTKVQGGIDDTRTRWVSTDTFREYVGKFMSSVNVTRISDGLAFQVVAQDIVDEFVDLAVEDTKTVALRPQFSDRATLTFADEALFDTESYEALAKSIADAHARSSTKLSFEDCQEFVEDIVAGASGTPAVVAKELGEQEKGKKPSNDQENGSTKAEVKKEQPKPKKPKAQAPQDSKNKKATAANPSNLGDCTTESFTDAKSGLTLNYDGAQKTWVPTTLNLHLLSREKFSKSLVAQFKDLKLSPVKEDNWMDIPLSAEMGDDVQIRLSKLEESVKFINPGRIRTVSVNKINTSIKNTELHPIFVTVSQATPNNGKAVDTNGRAIRGNATNSCDVFISIDGKVVARSRINSHERDRICQVSSMVPPGSSYKVHADPYLAEGRKFRPNGSLIYRWVEFY